MARLRHPNVLAFYGANANGRDATGERRRLLSFRRAPSRARRDEAVNARVRASGTSVEPSVDEDDEEVDVTVTSTSDRLEALLNKASTSPVNVHDIEQFYPYELDGFQVEATELLLRGSSVVVSAPTGSGKTLVGETAILTALARGERRYTRRR